MSFRVTESACQRDRGWCTACCGFFNLDLTADERRALVEERTGQFGRVDMQEPGQVVAYRATREKREERLLRRNDEIYVCPFLGRLEAGGRLGCLIHPARTGLPDSQRFSFYGASICASYDCRVKEEDDGSYAGLLARLFPESEAYSRLVADHALYAALVKGPRVWVRASHEEQVRLAFRTVCLARLRTDESEGITSFEIRHRYFDQPEQELLSILGDFTAAERSAVAILLDTDVPVLGPSE